MLVLSKYHYMAGACTWFEKKVVLVQPYIVLLLSWIIFSCNHIKKRLIAVRYNADYSELLLKVTASKKSELSR